MRWTSSSFMNGMGSLFRGAFPLPQTPSLKSINEIRQAMLAALGDAAEKRFALIQLRITYADDIDDLWYLRGDVMAAVASFAGEAIAKERLGQISEMFVGLVPSSLTGKLAHRHR